MPGLAGMKNLLWLRGLTRGGLRQKPAGNSSKRDIPKEAVMEFIAGTDVLPIGCLLQGLHKAEEPSLLCWSALRGLWFVLLVRFVLLLNPVISTFEIHDGILQILAEGRGSPSGSQDAFANVDTYENFWHWVEVVLYPSIYGEGGGGASLTLARYNHLVTPIRFRQVRTPMESCSDVAGRVVAWGDGDWLTRLDRALQPLVPASQAARHAFANGTFCWPEMAFGTIGEGQRPEGEMQLGQLSGSRHVAEGLPPLLDVPWGRSSGGHFVSLPLNDTDRAREVVRALVTERWTDEWTRATIVEFGTFNSNYDTLSAFRFRLDRHIGGSLRPSLDICSCRLEPFALLSTYLLNWTAPASWEEIGDASMHEIHHTVWEVIFALGSLSSFFSFLGNLCRQRARYMSGVYGWIHLTGLCCVAGALVGWSDYFGHHRSRFRSRSDDEFQDAYDMCSDYQSVCILVSVYAMLLFLRIIGDLMVYPQFMQVEGVFRQAGALIVKFMALVILGTCCFATSAHWLFGTRIDEFHTFEAAFGVLARTAHTWLDAQRKHETVSLYAIMREVDPVLANFWTLSWLLVSTLIFSNMFVAIIVSNFMVARRQVRISRELVAAYPLPPWLRFACCRRCCPPRDPDEREAFDKAVKDVASWRRALAPVDHKKLWSLLLGLIADGAKDLEVPDAMRLFPRRSPYASHTRALAWLRDVAQQTGAPLGDATDAHVAAEPDEIKATAVDDLMLQINSLEEETIGLTLQLHSLTLTGPIPQWI